MAGYAAIPFPAGVGVHEAVLIALFSSTGPAGVIAAVTVIHRLITVAVELAAMTTAVVLMQFREVDSDVSDG